MFPQCNLEFACKAMSELRRSMAKLQIYPLAVGCQKYVFFKFQPQQLIYKVGFWKGELDFILVFNNNHTSIMHRFRFNQVLPLAGKDFIALSPQGGAAGELYVRILKGRP